MKRWVLLLALLALLAWDAPAQTRKGLLKQVEASMLLTGRIDVAADGTVAGYSIDKAGQVPRDVLNHIARHVPHWEVAPAMVDGAPAASSSPFSLRLLARRIDGDRYSLEIANTHIEELLPEHERLRVRGEFTPPVYPGDLLHANVSGTVYLLLLIDHGGKVVDTHIEQVDLAVLATRQAAHQFRKRLANAALKAATGWAFHVPASGPPEGYEHHVVRMPIGFMIGDAKKEYGVWTMYLPGERMIAPWKVQDDGGNDAGVPGKPLLAGRGMRLVSRLEPAGS